MDILQHIEQLKKHLAELEKLVKEQGLGAQSEDSSGASVDSSRVAQERRQFLRLPLRLRCPAHPASNLTVRPFRPVHPYLRSRI